MFLVGKKVSMKLNAYFGDLSASEWQTGIENTGASLETMNVI
jgi:hypothetical protein